MNASIIIDCNQKIPTMSSKCRPSLSGLLNISEKHISPQGVVKPRKRKGSGRKDGSHADVAITFLLSGSILGFSCGKSCISIIAKNACRDICYQYCVIIYFTFASFKSGLALSKYCKCRSYRCTTNKVESISVWAVCVLCLCEAE